MPQILKDEWVVGSVLGVTPWSVVVAVVSRATEQTAALKCIRRAAFTEPDMTALVAALHRNASQPGLYVCAVFAVLSTPSFLYILQERFECSARQVLEDNYLETAISHTPASLYSIIAQLQQGLLALHRSGQPHGAVRPSNVLLRHAHGVWEARWAPLGIPMRHLGISIDANEGYFSPAQVEFVERYAFKTRMCRRWEQHGSCGMGSTCGFAHGPEELRPRCQYIRNGLRLGTHGHAEPSSTDDVFTFGCLVYHLATGRNPFVTPEIEWEDYVTNVQSLRRGVDFIGEMAMLQEPNVGRRFLLHHYIDRMIGPTRATELYPFRTTRATLKELNAHPFWWTSADYVLFINGLILHQTALASALEVVKQTIEVNSDGSWRYTDPDFRKVLIQMNMAGKGGDIEVVELLAAKWPLFAPVVWDLMLAAIHPMP